MQKCFHPQKGAPNRYLLRNQGTADPKWHVSFLFESPQKDVLLGGKKTHTNETSQV